MPVGLVYDQTGRVVFQSRPSNECYVSLNFPQPLSVYNHPVLWVGETCPIFRSLVMSLLEEYLTLPGPLNFCLWVDHHHSMALTSRGAESLIGVGEFLCLILLGEKDDILKSTNWGSGVWDGMGWERLMYYFPVGMNWGTVSEEIKVSLFPSSTAMGSLKLQISWNVCTPALQLRPG